MNNTEYICNLCNKAHGSFMNTFFETIAIICFFVFIIVILTIISSFSIEKSKLSIKNIFDKLKEKCFKKNLLKDHNFLKIYDERTNDFVYYLNDKFFNKINGKFVEIPFNKDIFNYDWNTRSIFKYYEDEDDRSNLEKNPKYIISINSSRISKIKKNYHTDWDLTEKFHNFCRKNEVTKYYVENL